jgi:hypothetical protein
VRFDHVASLIINAFVSRIKRELRVCETEHYAGYEDYCSEFASYIFESASIASKRRREQWATATAKWSVP